MAAKWWRCAPGRTGAAQNDSRSARQGRRPRDAHRRGEICLWGTLGLAHSAGGAVKPEKPDLILTGLQSDDLGLRADGRGSGRTLGLPHATIIMQAEVHNGSIRVKRELEERLVPEHRNAAARRADDSVRHQQTPVRHADGDQESQVKGDQAADGGRTRACAALPRPPSSGSTCRRESKQTQMLEGSAQEAAAKLVEKLRFEVRAI